VVSAAERSEARNIFPLRHWGSWFRDLLGTSMSVRVPTKLMLSYIGVGLATG
jgi:hypothetical protein